MRRDMDLIRELLLKLEALPMRRGGVTMMQPDDPDLQVAGYGVDQVGYHLALIEEAALIVSASPRPATGIAFRRLSWNGHDFVDSIRDVDIWEKTKQVAFAAGGWNFDLLLTSAKGYLQIRAAEALSDRA